MGKENEKPPEKQPIVIDSDGYVWAAKPKTKKVNPFDELGVQQTGDGVAIPNQSLSIETVPKK